MPRACIVPSPARLVPKCGVCLMQPSILAPASAKPGARKARTRYCCFRWRLPFAAATRWPGQARPRTAPAQDGWRWLGRTCPTRINEENQQVKKREKMSELHQPTPVHSATLCHTLPYPIPYPYPFPGAAQFASQLTAGHLSAPNIWKRCENGSQPLRSSPRLAAAFPFFFLFSFPLSHLLTASPATIGFPPCVPNLFVGLGHPPLAGVVDKEALGSELLHA